MPLLLPGAAGSGTALAPAAPGSLRLGEARPMVRILLKLLLVTNARAGARRKTIQDA